MIRREIVLPAPRDEVWDALTDAERLEEWFANDVTVDLRPGGGASFGWSNGESRTATVTEVDPEREKRFDAAVRDTFRKYDKMMKRLAE
jgi:uncharacterized protein YndB with AHSA1/START domain